MYKHKRVHVSATPTTVLPPEIRVDVGLTVVDVNSTWARLTWRKFSEFELQFIDGVQLRYKEKAAKVRRCSIYKWKKRAA